MGHELGAKGMGRRHFRPPVPQPHHWEPCLGVGSPEVKGVGGGDSQGCGDRVSDRQPSSKLTSSFGKKSTPGAP